jgi:hypothetical protein
VAWKIKKENFSSKEKKLIKEEKNIDLIMMSTNTKLFVNKNELVEYVNTKGQSSNTIEIFKIEEGLYKLVIKE